MKNLKSVLEEFDEKFTRMFIFPDESTDFEGRDDVKSFLTSSLISLLEECVPEKVEKTVEMVKDGWGNTYNQGKIDGKNACRQKILDNIATITKL